MSDNNIELRSMKVRRIIGEIPKGIVSYGITIITIVIGGLLASIYYIPYTETICTKVQMANAQQGIMTIPYRYVRVIKEGMHASIEFEDYDTEEYGITSCTIVATSHTPHQTIGGSVFSAEVKITNCKYKLTKGMSGTAHMLINNESILQRIMHQITNSIR